MRKLIVLILLIITSTGNVIKAQQNHAADKKYSVIIPDDYQDKGKSYPLVVCYQNQATDSLFQSYANNTQTIILQFNHAPDTALKSESLKKIILTTIQDFTVARDKIYLLGVNQNISKTIEIHEEMNFYFAATAYITSDQDKYTLLNDSLKQSKSIKLYFFDAIDYNALDIAHNLFLQHHLWGVEVQKISEEAISFSKADDKDDKKSWQLSLSYGQWHFDNAAKSEESSILEFPKNMGAWNLSFAKYLSEQLSVNVNLGILIKKDVPPTPDVFSILGGADVEIEGGGIFFMPVSVGMDYFFTKQRFRPYTGFSLGVVPAGYRYVEASGNISDGINRDENKFNSKAPFGELSAGFVYRTGKNVQLGLNFDYLKSKRFDENIGGYQAYNGFKVSVGFSVLLK